MATSSRAMTFGVIAGGGLLLAWLASRSKASAAAQGGAAEPADPHEAYQKVFDKQLAPSASQSDPNDPHTQYQASFGKQVATPVSPELDPLTLAENTPLGPARAFPSMPLQPVTAPSSSSSSSSSSSNGKAIPAPKVPPITVRAEAGNVVTLKPAAAPTPAAAKRTDKTAALELLAYVTPILKAKRGAELGTKNAPNSFVKAAQVDMGVTPDGIYGPETRTRGKQLIGSTFPARV